MTQQSSEAEWPARLALSIAAEVRRHRQAQGLSAQQLSDRCRELGMPIQRSVLANLESGRRTTVTVAEVLVLAEALEVAPAVLVFPAGYRQEVEVLPSVEVSPLRATDWFGGRTRLSGHPVSAMRSPLATLRHHWDLVGELRLLLADRERLRSDALAAQQQAGERRHRAEVAVTLLAEAESRLARGDADEGEAKAEHASRVEQRQTAEAEALQAEQAAKFVEYKLDSIESTITNVAIRVGKARRRMEEKGWLVPSLAPNLLEVVQQREGMQDQGDIHTPISFLNDEV